MGKLVLLDTARKTGIKVKANFPKKNEMTPIAATPRYIVNLETSFSLIVSSSLGSTSNLSVEKFKCFEPFALASIMAIIPRKKGIFLKKKSRDSLYDVNENIQQNDLFCELR